jgi:hypothetical protein
MSQTRAEHLTFCKQRANEYIDQGDIPNAVTSMASDLGKHPETEGHPGITLGMMMLMSGNLSDPREARRFIDGFN